MRNVGGLGWCSERVLGVASIARESTGVSSGDSATFIGEGISKHDYVP